MARDRHREEDPDAEAEREGPAEIAFVGELSDNESELTEKLLDVAPGEECVLYFDSPGGSPYAGVSLMMIIILRGLKATGVVTGECSSAALWPFAACQARFVTPFSYLLFHPIKWESDERLGLAEAAEWARHFRQLEEESDELLARFFGLSRERLAEWMTPGRYVSGAEFAEHGLAQMAPLEPLEILRE